MLYDMGQKKKCTRKQHHIAIYQPCAAQMGDRKNVNECRNKQDKCTYFHTGHKGLLKGLMSIKMH